MMASSQGCNGLSSSSHGCLPGTTWGALCSPPYQTIRIKERNGGREPEHRMEQKIEPPYLFWPNIRSWRPTHLPPFVIHAEQLWDTVGETTKGAQMWPLGVRSHQRPTWRLTTGVTFVHYTPKNHIPTREGRELMRPSENFPGVRYLQKACSSQRSVCAPSYSWSSTALLFWWMLSVTCRLHQRCAHGCICPCAACSPWLIF